MTISTQKKLKVTRRHVIGGIASLPFVASFTPTYAWASMPEVNKFIYASSVLCGVTMDKSYIQLAQKIWSALTAKATDKDLREWQQLIDKIAKLPPKSDSARIKKALRSMGTGVSRKARQLAKVWFTGRIAHPNTAEKFDVINYDEALVWIVCDFIKPPVTCGGHFGYWQHPFTGKV